ncbi:hypothetical protein HPB50_004333 [Hyalomma asiaticum]|uniref:Uncharacterized protein n=1 Tax=Hyalomma asiaticum TaxID=266040 RepID=A0ACB7SJ61_HYAAI|nr:hypothetical protein HPB50_004333 [Hyalomma asiaticum]
MEPDHSGGQMDVGLNTEMTRFTEESSGGSGSYQMSMLEMQLRIAEMELAMERLRNENGARAAATVQSTEADRKPTGTNIKLTGAFGDETVAELAYVPLRLLGKPQCIGREGEHLGILCAVTDKLANVVDALIAPEDYRELLGETAAVNERAQEEEAPPKPKEQVKIQVTARVEAVCIDGEIEQTTAQPEQEGTLTGTF